MATISAYWRPDSIENALELLERPGAVVLGGGTKLNATPTSGAVEAVDLQALGLEEIIPLHTGAVLIGAMATLEQIAGSDDVPGVVREAARREEPSTFRAQSTLGGCLLTADPDSELLAALLVHEALVREVGQEGAFELDLEAWLADDGRRRGRVVTAVTVATGGKTASARTGRTRSDKPIVAAVARSAGGHQRLALTGVAARPILVEDLKAVDPPGDFRGSSEYRRTLAKVLGARVLEAIS